MATDKYTTFRVFIGVCIVAEQYVWPEVLRERMKLAGVNFFM